MKKIKELISQILALIIILSWMAVPILIILVLIKELIK
jgi:hypothetical protein